MVRYTDHLVGRLVGAIDDLGLRKNTIIIFTTDNGTGGGVLGTVRGKRPSGGKASKWEGGVCEPFVVNCPGIVPAGVETDALTDFSDLLPTFAELGGAELPKNRTLDGKSFAPLILGKAQDSPREWIMALGHGAARLDKEGVRGKADYTARVIRDKRYKVWVNENREISALYDLKNDPLEKNNLVDGDEASVAAVLEKFQAVVDATPDRDARPQYRKREALAWDKKVGGEKKARPKRKRNEAGA